jgi:non-haem Fe2+, alpha-ketoglutarate-dependent halogenase
MTDDIQSKRNSFALSEAELRNFNEHGYIGPFTLYEPEEMHEEWRRQRLMLMDRSNAVYAVEHAESGVTNIANYDRHLDNEFLATHICRPEIAERVASILGPDVLCWRTEFFPKYPGDEGTDWHQADTFANASGTPQIVWPNDSDFGGTITVWSAFTEATIQNGCLQFIRGSYRAMNYDETKRMHYEPGAINALEKDGVRRGFFGYDYRQLQIDPNWKPDESKAISLEMRAGQFVIFWSTLMHASHPHSGATQNMRLGFAARYVPTCVKIYPDTDVIEEYGGRVSLEKYGAVQVSGSDRYSFNRLIDCTTTGFKFPAHQSACR